MEGALRPFLNHWQDAVMGRMWSRAGHNNSQCRRMVTECTRPRLPWGMAVGLELSEPLPLLDVLHSDATRYVTRSVANHLNDITKKDPNLVLDRLEVWRDRAAQDRKELDWMTSHALRGLIKAGHPRAMTMLGYDPEAEVTARVELKAEAVRIGDVLEFACHLEAPQDLPVLVDYRLYFQRPGGKVSAKVFKLKQAKLGRKGVSLTKRHALKGNASTFTLVPGTHRVELMVNGRVRDEVEFELLA